MSSTAYVSHPSCLRHDMGPDHPESPARLKAVEDQLIASGVFPFLLDYEAPLASREEITRVHSPALFDRLEAASPTPTAGGVVWLDEETALGPGSFEAARRAAGAVVLATDLVLTGKAENAFCNVRPPGHHATRDQAMGFCLFNNLAVGVAQALEAHSLERVAVIDFDAHHGNGTEDIFREDRRVLLCSSFQEGLYAEGPAGPPHDRLVTLPLPPGTDGRAFRAAIERHFIPALEQFLPQMLFLSAGFDAHREDPLARLALMEDDFAWITRALKTIAARRAAGRLVSVLEGGYALHPLGRSATAHIRVLCDL